LKKKIFLTLFIGAIIFFTISVAKIKAGTGSGGIGWLWGGTDDGSANSTGVGWISMNNVTPGAGGAVSYGVNIPTIDGSLSGYAWSENVGWISFNGTDLANCPGATPAQRVGNSIQGWARIIGIKTEYEASNSGGWLGCVKLNGTAQNGSTYGVQINTGVTPNTLSGYAWSDELGWIDFSRASVVDVGSNLKICRDSCDSGGLVSSSTAETMYVNGTKNYKACYNSSAACDTNTGDVTTSATLTANNSPNDVINILSDGTITAGATAGTEGVSVVYNPGMGNVSTNFNVQVNTVTLLTCWTCNNGTCTSYSQATCSPGDFSDQSNCQANCTRDNNWKEVVP
jgi:hypothetical protein